MSILITAAGCAATGGGLALVVLTALEPKTNLDEGGAGQGGSARSRAPRGAAARAVDGSALARRALLAAGAGIALAAATSWPVLTVIGAAGVWFLPGLLRSDGGAAAKTEKVNAVATFTEMMRDTLNAAAGLGQAITAAATCAPAPISVEARALSAAITERSVPMDKALRRFGDQLADPAGDLVVIALMHAARNSAHDLAPLLSDLAEAARAEASMRVRIQTARARTRTAVRMITAVTLGLGIVLYVFDGPFLRPYGSPLGQLALLVIAALFATGFAWLRRLARPSEQPRILRPEAKSDNAGTQWETSGAGAGFPAPRRDSSTALTAAPAGRR